MSEQEAALLSPCKGMGSQGCPFGPQRGQGRSTHCCFPTGRTHGFKHLRALGNLGLKKKNKQTQTASWIPSSVLTACLAHLVQVQPEAEQLFFVSKRKGQGIVFYTLHCESVNGFAAHNVQGLFRVSARASPHPGGTTGPNSRVSPGWGGGCGWLVGGGCCPVPRAGDLSQTCTWLLDVRLSSIRRCLRSPRVWRGRAGSFPRKGAEFQQLPSLFFGISLTHEQEIKFSVFLLEWQDIKTPSSVIFLPKWIFILCSLVLMRNHLSVKVGNATLDKIKNYFCLLPPPWGW